MINSVIEEGYLPRHSFTPCFTWMREGERVSKKEDGNGWMICHVDENIRGYVY